MTGFVVEVLSGHEAGRTRRLAGSRVVLGTSPSAELRIEGCAELADEHAIIEPSEEGCRVTAISGAPVTVEGAPHDDGGLVPWGAEIAIGTLRLRFAAGAERARPRSSPLLAAAPLVLGIALWMIFSEPTAAGIQEAPAPPALFASAPGRCESGPSPAHHRAERDDEAASAKAQRYPFAPHDGVEAVELHRRAAACYAASDDREAAARATSRARRMQRRVEADYSTSRFRLEQALRNQDWRSAVAEAQVLSELLRDRDDPYVTWLAVLERRLRLAQPGERSD